MKKKGIGCAIGLVALSLTILFVVLILIDDGPPSMTFRVPSSPTAYSFSVLSANVGNLSLGCRSVLNKLCYKDVEERITAHIRQLRPDIVALQEVLAPWQCEKIQEKNPKKVCFEAQLVPQARRLLGPDYTISCNTRNEFECIGVHTSLGEIAGCEPGGYCVNARTSPALDGCDNGFNVSAGTIRLRDGFTFDLVNAHPQSTDSACRAKMIRYIFEGDELSPALIESENVLLMGDFNLDPWRDRDESALTWQNYFDQGWAGRPFVYHSGMAEKDPPTITSRLFTGKTVDFIASNFAAGLAYALGESPGTDRLDGGKGMDHRGLFGYLTLPSTK